MSAPQPVEVAVTVEAEGWPEDVVARAEAVVHETLKHAGVKVAGVAEVSVLLTDDAHQRALNRQWRGIDQSTNVLSFPQLPPFAPIRGLVGDISLARETLEREAAEMTIDFEDHFTHLVVHGVLHLLGYDHENADEALQMEALETQILARLGIADPYGDG